MSEMRKIQLWARDYSEVLFETECPWGELPQDAEDFLRTSGHDWLPMVISWGDGWKERWAGRLELKADGTETHGGSEYLRHILTWPNPFQEDMQIPTREQSGDGLHGPQATRAIERLFGA